METRELNARLKWRQRAHGAIQQKGSRVLKTGNRGRRPELRIVEK